MRLCDLEEWYALGGRCSKCQHKGWLDRYEIVRRFGSKVLLVSLMPKLRCTACHNGRGNFLQAGKIKR